MSRSSHRRIESVVNRETWSTGAATWSTGAGSWRRGQQVRRNVGPAGSWRRGQQVRTWVNRCGETWSTGADVGQQVRRNVVNRCRTWVNRCRETWSTGAAKRGVRRGAETWSAGAARRGQQVRGTRSAGAWNAVSRCGKRGQQVRGTRSTGAAKHCFRQCSQGFVNPARSSRSPRSFPERGEGREPVAACFAADAARRHRMLLHTGLSHR